MYEPGTPSGSQKAETKDTQAADGLLFNRNKDYNAPAARTAAMANAVLQQVDEDA